MYGFTNPTRHEPCSWRRGLRVPHTRSPLLLLLAAILIVAGGTSPLAAHDFWIEPNQFEAQGIQPLRITLRVGDHFVGDMYPRNPRHIQRFELHTADGKIDVPGRVARSPAGVLPRSPAKAGVLVYESTSSEVTLPGPRFEAYLIEAGLPHISALRAQRGRTAAPGRERYTRHAKCLLRGAATADASTDADPLTRRALGLELEIVPAHAPAVGRDLTVQVLIHGKPASGLLLRAMHQKHADHPITATTDTDGRATVTLKGTGVWLLGCVHMTDLAPTSEASSATPPTPDEPALAWHSRWATLTFELPAPSASDSMASRTP